MRPRRKKMINRGRRAFRPISLLLFPFILGTLVIPYSGQSALAQSQMQTREKLLGADFYPEEGCPVRPTDIKVVLDVDPFGAPADCKIYITYTNNSSKPISAVKFRCRFADNLGKDRGTFHAVDTYSTSPGGSRSQRWKREGALSPSISAFQMRALQVLFSDGSVWQSQKMEELATPEGTPQWQQGSEPAGITQQMSQ